MAAGRRTSVASFDSAAVSGNPPELAGNVLNEVALDFNDLSLPAKEYQAHAGPKDANSPKVEYAYDDTAEYSVYTKAMRPRNVVYPSGRRVWTTYGDANCIADRLSRPDAVNDDSGQSPPATGDPLTRGPSR